jgi:hypothetical protein
MSNTEDKNTGKHNTAQQDSSNQRNLGGRPTSYREEYVEAARRFFKKAHWDEENKLWKFPSRVWFAEHINTPLQTVKDWEKAHPEFGDAIAEGIERSKELRITFAENEKINPAFAKYVLSSAYGMTEKSAVEVGNIENKAFELNINVVRK